MTQTTLPWSGWVKPVAEIRTKENKTMTCCSMPVVPEYHHQDDPKKIVAVYRCPKCSVVKLQVHAWFYAGMPTAAHQPTKGIPIRVRSGNRIVGRRYYGKRKGAD